MTPAQTLNSPTAGRRVRATDRAKEVLDLRRQGLTFAAIGAVVGITKGRAHQIVTAYLEEITQAISEHGEALRAQEADRLNTAAGVLWPAVMAGDLAAHDRWIKNRESFRKLTGIDLRPDMASGVTIQLVESRPPWEREGWGEGDVIEGTSEPMELPAST